MPVTNYIWDVVSDNVLMEVDDEGNKVAGFGVGTIVRRVISTNVGGVDKIEIQWPPQ